MATGILQALGDSRHPLYFLIASSLTNIVLDLLFVGVLDWGMDGAAYATIISEAISAVLSMGLLFLTKEQYRVHLRQVRFHGRQLGRILHIGIPSGIQNSVISIANVFVQASVNSFGAAAMAGNGAFLRIQGFVFLPITSFALALTTFTSQNIGAGELGRVRKGIRFSLAFCLIMAETFGLFLFLFAKPLLLLFSRDPEVLAIGTEKAHIACFFFCCLALSHTMAGIFRGAGRAIIPMLVMLVCWCLIRVSYIFITLKYFNDIRVVFWAYPITWTLSSLIFIFYYFKVDWLRQR
jgi:putative MATE family efflux protein